jgi:hypothetical protein
MAPAFTNGGRRGITVEDPEMFLQVACVSIIALLLGLVVTFFGYRFFLRLLPFWGFVVGFALGAGLTSVLLGEGLLATTSGWIFGFFVGLILAAFSYLFYIVGVAIFAGSLGYALGAGLVYAIFNDPVLTAFIAGAVGAVLVAGATLLLNLQKWVIITLTAAGGASTLLFSVLLFLGRIALADLGTNPVRAVLDNSFWWSVVWLVLFGAGWFVQFVSTTGYAMRPTGRRAW